MSSTVTETAPSVGTTNGRVAPGPKGVPLLGSIPAISKKGLIQFYVDAWKEHGDLVRIQAGPLTQYLLIQPDHIKYVLQDNRQNYEKGIGMRKLKLTLGAGLFTSEGEVWKRHRSFMQPTFTPRGITRFTGDMVNSTQKMLDGWSARATDGRAFNVNSAMMRLAMDIISRTMFSRDIGRDALDASRAFTYVLEHISRRSLNMIDIPLFVPTRPNRRFNSAIKTLDSFIYGIIAERKRDPAAADDLLSTLLEARDPETGEGMSLQQIRDEVITIFFAGHETTAQALTWTWYLLAQHPEVEEKLYEEVDRVLGGRTPSTDDLRNLHYTSMVVEEAMRLYPPVWVFVRQALRDDEIGGYHIPAGSMIVFSQYITHRHPAYWEGPDKFDPERFSPERSAGRPKYAYFPFGGGPRICLGNNFAMMEATAVVGMVAQKYRLRLVPGQHIEPRMVGTLRPNGPVRMTLHPRA